jgi:hypothetical protein
MRITKITFKGDKIQIVWEREVNGEIEVRSVATKTEPHSDFVRAWINLDKAICVEAEMPQDPEESKRHNIIGLNCSYEQDEFGSIIMSASITSERFMLGYESTMKITSPMKPESGSYALYSKTVDAVYKVIDEAVLFLDGKRHDLFAEAS